MAQWLALLLSGSGLPRGAGVFRPLCLVAPLFGQCRAKGEYARRLLRVRPASVRPTGGNRMAFWDSREIEKTYANRRGRDAWSL